MITISFLSGELVHFDDLFDGATIYNMKRMICDWMEEEKEYDSRWNEIELIHIYDKENNELDNNEKITDDLYKAFINKYDPRILYTKNGNVYYYRENESPNEQDSQIFNDDISSLKETSSIKYYFNLSSFISSWNDTPSFFEENGYTLLDDNRYNDLYPSIHPSSEEDELDEKQIKYRTIRCLVSLFKNLKIKYL